MGDERANAAFEMAREVDRILAQSGAWYEPPRWRNEYWNATHRLPRQDVEAAFKQLVRIYPREYAQRLFLEDPSSDAACTLRWPNPFLAAQDSGLRLGLDAAAVGLMNGDTVPRLVHRLRCSEQFRGASFEMMVWAAFECSGYRYVHESQRTDGGTLDLCWEAPSGPVDIEVKTVSDVDNSKNARLAGRVVEIIEAEAQRAGLLVTAGMVWCIKEIPGAEKRYRKFVQKLEADLEVLRLQARTAFAEDAAVLEFTSSRLFRASARRFANSCGSYELLPHPDRQQARRVVRNALKRVIDGQASRERPFAVVLRVPRTITTEALHEQIAKRVDHGVSPDWFLGCLVERTVRCRGRDVYAVPSFFAPLPSSESATSNTTLQGIADVLNKAVLQRHVLLDHVHPGACLLGG